MKRLIISNDGTWNTPDQEENGIACPTNVTKLHNALEEKDSQGTPQLRYYHPGVGSSGSKLDAVFGGAFGAGISAHIRSAYHWIGSNYEPGDEIYLFGFSRGAFAARSLAGFLDHGLLDLRGLDSDGSWLRVEAAYEHYRKPAGGHQTSAWAKPDWSFHHKEKSLPIRFVGVWDTVGALGIPDDLELLNLTDDSDRWKFHDTNLSPRVQTARHAMAMDEVRASFAVTRWNNAQEHADAVELWFPGVHSDVGGGYAQTDLSDGALLWMIEEAEKAGLAFRPGVRKQLKPEPLGVMHNSFKGAFAKLRSRPRNLPPITTEAGQFHPSALARFKDSPIAYDRYHPTRILAVGETSDPVDIFAKQRWNRTGLYLEPGSYWFSSQGKWQDASDSCDWKGTENDGRRTLGDLMRGASSFVGELETIWKNVTKNASTDFLLTKRVEEFPWFALIGAITNDGVSAKAVANDGSPRPHQYIQCCTHATEGTAFVLSKPGYLYAFANDAWSRYENNRGSVTLQVKRIA